MLLYQIFLKFLAKKLKYATKTCNNVCFKLKSQKTKRCELLSKKFLCYDYLCKIDPGNRIY